MAAIVEDLRLTSLCSDDPNQQRRWRVRNPNAFNVNYTWKVLASSETATEIAPPGDSIFFTTTVPGANTTRIRWLDGDGKVQQSVKASGGVQCPPSFGDLDIRKTIISGPDVVTINDSNTWRVEIQVENTGHGPVINTIMTDIILLDNIDNVNILSISKGSASFSNDDIIWNIGTLNSSEIVNLVVDITGSFTSTGNKFLNEANVTGIIPTGPISAGPKKGMEIIVDPAPIVPELDLEKTLVSGPTTISKGQIATWEFKFTASNVGTAVLNNVVVTDVVLIDEITQIVDNVPSKGSVIVSGNNVNWNIGQLGVGESATLNIEITGFFKSTGLLALNQAIATGIDANTLEEVFSDIVSGGIIQVEDGLTILKNIVSGHVAVNVHDKNSWNIQLKVINNSPDTVDNVVVTDNFSLDNILQINTISLSKGNVQRVNNQVIWNIGSMNSGEIVVLELKVTGIFESEGTRIINTASVEGIINSHTIIDGPTTATAIIVKPLNEPISDMLQLQKLLTGGPKATLSNDINTWEFTFTISNTSSIALENVILDDVVLLDNVVDFQVVSISKGFIDSDPTCGCWEIGTLAPGESATAVIEITGSFEATGLRSINTAIATGVNSNTLEVVESKIVSGGFIKVIENLESVCIITDKVYSHCQQRECFDNFEVDIEEGTFNSITFQPGFIVEGSLIVNELENRENFKRVRFTLRIPFTITRTDGTTFEGFLPDILKDIIIFIPSTRDEFDFRIVTETSSKVLDTPTQTNTTVSFAVGIFVIIKVVGRVQLLIPAFGFCLEPPKCIDFKDENICKDFDSSEFPSFFPQQYEDIYPQ